MLRERDRKENEMPGPTENILYFFISIISNKYKYNFQLSLEIFRLQESQQPKYSLLLFIK